MTYKEADKLLSDTIENSGEHEMHYPFISQDGDGLLRIYDGNGEYILKAIVKAYEMGVKDEREEIREWLTGEDFEGLAERL